MSRPWRIRTRRIHGPNCNHLSDVPCDACEADRRAAATRPIRAPALQFFREQVFEHMYDPWEKMPPISSPEALRLEADKRGVQSRYLQESLIWRSGPKRWI